MNDISETIEKLKTQDTDIYSSNSYVRNIEPIIITSNSNKLTSDSHTFLQDTNAYVHATINGSSATIGGIDIIYIMINTNDGWKPICQEPLKKSIFDIDLHGFFYAGTEIQISSRNFSGNTSLTNINGYLEIVEFSIDKPFSTKSFEWRETVQNLTDITGNTGKVLTGGITGTNYDGLIKVSGKFSNKNSLTASNITSIPWYDPTVYVNLIDGSSVSTLVNTYTPIPFQKNNSTDYVDDNFQSRFYYVNDGSKINLSADVKLTDDKGSTNLGGFKNWGLIQYYQEDELSNVIQLEDDFKNVGDLDSKFGENDGVNYHTFTYGKYLGRPSNKIKTSPLSPNLTSEYGTLRKNQAWFGIGSSGPNFIREKFYDNTSDESPSRTIYSVASPDDEKTIPMNRVVRNNSELNDYLTSNINEATSLTSNDNLIGSVKFETEILNKNLRKLKCFPGYLKVSGTTLPKGTDDLNIGITGYMSYMDSSATLKGVNFAEDGYDDNNNDITIDDSAFAFCTSLENITIPNKIKMDGNCTFYMGDNSYLKAQYLKKISDTLTILTGKVTPLLTSVTFTKYGDNPFEIVEKNGERPLNYTFFGCSKLTSVNVKDTNATQFIGTFRNCSELTNITFPLTLKTVSDKSFNGCKTLSSVIFNSELINIEKNSFDYSLTALTANNNYSNNQFNYKLNDDYFFGIMLSNDLINYINKNDIFSEIKKTLETLMKITPFINRRRLFILDKDGKYIEGNGPFNSVNDFSENVLVYDPSKDTSPGSITPTVIQTISLDKICKYIEGNPC